LAVKLPDGVNESTLTAVLPHKILGRLLIFDPTDDLTPFGYLRGPLQSNYGLLVTENGGELIELPKLAAAMNGTRRPATLTLTSTGRLTGDISELRLGDHGSHQRYALRSATTDKDKIKPIESVLAHSLATYRITKASVTNLQQSDQPFGYNYSLI